MESRLREMSHEKRRPWIFGDENQDDDGDTSAASSSENDQELHDAIVASVMQMSLEEERRQMAGIGTGGNVLDAAAEALRGEQELD